MYTQHPEGPGPWTRLKWVKLGLLANRPTLFRVSVASNKHLYQMYIRNQHDILEISVGEVSKDQKDMSYKGEF